jgi:glycerol-3-phosphate acyltransferase PlsY
VPTPHRAVAASPATCDRAHTNPAFLGIKHGMSVLAHAGHWLFAMPPLTLIAGLLMMVVVDRRRGDADADAD